MDILQTSLWQINGEGGNWHTHFQQLEELLKEGKKGESTAEEQSIEQKGVLIIRSPVLDARFSPSSSRE